MSDTNAVTAALFIVALIGFFAGSLTGMQSMEAKAIERGYGLHCPIEGNFEWKGECNE